MRMHIGFRVRRKEEVIILVKLVMFMHSRATVIASQRLHRLRYTAEQVWKHQSGAAARNYSVLNGTSGPTARNAKPVPTQHRKSRFFLHKGLPGSNCSLTPSGIFFPELKGLPSSYCSLTPSGIFFLSSRDRQVPTLSGIFFLSSRDRQVPTVP